MESRPRIPNPNIPSSDSKIVPPVFQPVGDGILFSFKALEGNEYFNIDMTCSNWPADLFGMMKNLSGVKKKELEGKRYGIYRYHNHESAKPPCPLPSGVTLKDFHQLRLGKSNGAIHGVFSDNVFYVMWLDPLHNMYPDSRYGGLKLIRPPSTCCMYRDNELETLSSDLDTLHKENNKQAQYILELEDFIDKEFKKEAGTNNLSSE